ncbi:N-terminal binuclear Zn cluster-containing protein [Trichoderma citrinoviride]|uniref:N-terminal binuclear Zn cluster-containing protein n=1 Tax=Trichoderma citrinoviride TaxID=58853 RepID=A0A2T4BBR7_9HYPO|nr:N-terminal binuclear Zn cluster-containing protein [Trichoderma citrinoviride]PTB66770.1 N-terminal binuclear Zn cluster-containing protein [Trichoderma citrinoviride]
MDRRYESLATTPAPFACLACRDSKRRCDRALPQCRGCLQKRIVCDYPYRRKKRERKTQPAPSNAVVSPTSGLLTDQASLTAEISSHPSPDYDAFHPGSSQSAAANFLTERFLDPEAFVSAQLKVPEPSVDHLITKEVSDFVGDVANIKAISDKFFTSVHEWMPIVSRIQFLANLVGWLTHKRAELFFLILAMRLSSEQVSNPRSRLYQVTKYLQFRLEHSGVLSLQVIQASVLVALYEIGHGVYPSAYLSIAGCARYATALGIDQSILCRDLNGISWNELEERRRVWWSILVLDSRHLVTPDPILENWLPVDDAAFNDGSGRPEDAYTLGSATALDLGRFARFAQAAHLLGQVLRHVAEGSPESETAQLRRTIFSLVSISKLEAHLRQMEFCSQTAVCYCGILLLDSSQAKNKDRAESFVTSLDQMSTETNLISQSALQMSNYLITRRSFMDIHNRSSPFLLHMMYRVALLYLESSRPTPGDTTADKLHLIKQGMEIIGRRWQIAQSYLSLLSRHEIMQAMK